MSDLSAQIIDLADTLRRLDAMTPQQAGDLYAQAQVVKANFRAWCQLIDGGFIDYMLDHHTDIPIKTADGEKRLYVGTEKRTKCPSPKATLERLLNLTGGDLGTVAECLSSGAWKPGACRELLGDQWGECFTVEEVPDIKTGTAKRVVKTTQEE